MGDLPCSAVLGMPGAGAGRCWRWCPATTSGPGSTCWPRGLTFLAALVFLMGRGPRRATFILVDDFNVYLIVLNTFVGFTTSIYSAPATSTTSSRPAG